MTWFRLPLFVWSMYATSVVIVLGTPVVAITLLLDASGARVPPAVLQLPSWAATPCCSSTCSGSTATRPCTSWCCRRSASISELISNFSRKRIFGYHFVAFSSLAIAGLGFLVWGHHMFVSSQSMYEGLIFSLLSFLVAVPSAIKIFNWTLTLYKGNIRLQSPMLYALGFLGLFTIGGLTGLFLASAGTDIHLTATYFVVAHFHYVMVGGSLLAFLGGLHYWWPKMTGRMFNDAPGEALRAPGVHRVQRHVLPAVHRRLARNAPPVPLLLLRAGVPDL